MPVAEVVFVLVVLLGIAMLVTGVCRKLPFPFTVALVVIGVLLGNLAERWPLLHPLQDFELSPEMFWLPICKKLRACNEPRGWKLIMIPGPFDFPSYR